MNLRNKGIDFLNSKKEFPFLTIFSAGLYPFLHYFNNNLNISNSWQQLLFMLLLCFVLPIVVLWLSAFIFKLNVLKRFQDHRLAFLNFSIFLVLIGLFIFSFKKKATVLMIVLACILALTLYKHLKKIIVLQLIMSAISFISLISVLTFALGQDNKEWATLSKELLDLKLKYTPNIFVIQPDGYINRSEMNKPPYEIDNSSFYTYLDTKGFKNYNNFRSNYYSTMTSNSSMFAMKHHYYGNTYQKSAKTFNANEAIVGQYNNVLTILNNNAYRTHMLMDNSFFLIDRKKSNFNYCNVTPSQVPYINTGRINRDIVADLKNVLDTISSSKNFFFIEKTVPSHINYSKGNSLGKEGERKRYINRLQDANIWLKNLVETIENYDEDALIIIQADHGGFVGLDYTLQAVEQKIDSVEAISAFSSMLSIKWPSDLKHDNLEFKSSVNLFRVLLNGMAERKLFDDDLDNNSYIPNNESGTFEFYKVIDESGKVFYDKIEKR
ncbi:hypothetical protein [uncultured Psychroserpens sp.]|uniref:hypothetical protein n=1 Tax=uncultured Psychroserpens sp. TaxID=255436 RepID=UPI00263294A5|nr:hypothetical protein [uncultured Psychroserpens sp.]